MLAPTASESSLPQGSIFRNGLDPVDTEFDAPCIVGSSLMVYGLTLRP